MKKKQRFENLKKLLEMEETPPWIRTTQQRVIAKKIKQPGSYKNRMAPLHNPCHQVQATLSVMQRAEAVQENLDAELPSFVKPMIRSNVTKGFWLSLPKLFCHLHLPIHDTTIVLEDEHHRQYRTKYLAERRGLSAGWMGFSIAHNLVEGDVLVFQMVRHYKLKVYIIRSSHLDEVDAALSLMHLDPHATEMGSGHRTIDGTVLKPTGEKNLRSTSQSIVDNGAPNSHVVKVIDHSEKLVWDLQLALQGLISKTCSIANAVKAGNANSFSNDLAMWNKQMIDYEQMRINLGQIHAQLDQLLFLVLEPKPFYINRYKGAVYMRNQDRETAEGNMLLLKETIKELYSEIQVLRINAEMLELKL